MDITWMNGASGTTDQPTASPPAAIGKPAASRATSKPGDDTGHKTTSTGTAPSWQKLAAILLLVVGFFGIVGWTGWLFFAAPVDQTVTETQWPVPSEFDAQRAYGYLEQIVDFGPRPSGSENMLAQQKFLQNFFESQGAEVEMQTFDHRHPETGKRIELVNIIARYRPAAKKRYLLCAHYDTRPYPDSDRDNPKGVFVGANDGGSGTAALMEFSHHVDSLPKTIGVDLVLFDAEELIYDPKRDEYFLGSTYFAQQYVVEQKSPNARPPYIAGVLLDMIGDRELQLFYERNSWNYARDITVEIWATAKSLRIGAFEPRIRHLLRDDHLPLNQIARVPTTDLIDFDYPRPGFRQQSYWHTTKDTIENCSGESLVAVLYVVHTWLSSKG